MANFPWLWQYLHHPLARSKISGLRATGIYSLGIAHRLNAKDFHRVYQGGLPQVCKCCKGFKALGTNLLDLIAELDKDFVFIFGQGFCFPFIPQSLVLV
jgi:hypothetical protein